MPRAIWLNDAFDQKFGNRNKNTINMLRLKSLSGILSFSQGSLCSKWSPFALTHEWRRVRHCLTALSIMHWSSSSQAALMRSRNSSTFSIRLWTLTRLCRELRQKMLCSITFGFSQKFYHKFMFLRKNHYNIHIQESPAVADKPARRESMPIC